MSHNIVFYNETLGRHITIEQVQEEIAKYIHEQPKAEYKITVGTDSPATAYAQFVTAVTVLRVGNGGRYFWTRSEKNFCPTLRERIYKEAIQSITLAQELKSRLKEKLGEEFFWDGKVAVHIDIGNGGPTKDLIEGVMGMVRGYGLEAAIKPYAFAASTVADRHI
jgi:predicted RNase H-related nuclease YkuK (DUF458 family)